MKLFWFIFLTSILSHVKAQQPNKTLIEGNLAKITTNFMQIETNVNKRMSTYGMQLMYCESNLKASKLPTNFTETILTFMSAVRAVQYMQNHQISDLSKMNMSNYDYTQTRIMTLPTDIKLYSSIIGQLQTNGKMIQTYLRNITKHYMKNFRTLVKIPSKNKLMLAAIRESIGISNNFGAYIRLLKIRTTYLIKVNAYLNALITNKIVIPSVNITLDPFMAKLKENEDKLAPKQAVTKNATLNALTKITAAQKTVQNFVGSSSTVTELMQSMKDTFLEITATDDFPDLAWPRLPDIAGDKTMIKLRANLCEGKEQKLKDIEEKNKKRHEKIKIAREKLNGLTLSSSSKKVQASQAILDLIEATKGVETSYDGYKAGISQASTGMTQIREVFVPTTTTTSTTMRMPATLITKQNLSTTAILNTSTFAPSTSMKQTTSSSSTSTSTSTSITLPPTTSTTTLPSSSSIPSTTTLEPTTTKTLPPTTKTLETTTSSTLPPTTTTLETTTSTTTSLPSTTSTSLTTTTTAPPCGTFVPYDTGSNLAGPSVNGFSAGIHEDGRHAYVGYGADAECRRTVSPGMISDDPAKPGIYIGCGYKAFFRTTNAFYLLNHPDLRWVQTTASTVSSVANKLKVSEIANDFYFPRLVSNNFVYLGKIHGLSTYCVNKTIEWTALLNFDVLVCDPTIAVTTPVLTTTTSLTTTTTAPPCGTFVPYYTVNNPTGPSVNGFSAGIHEDGRHAYVGYGALAECSMTSMPGMISDDPAKPGIYIGCSWKAHFRSTNAFYLLNHPNLRWVQTTISTISAVTNKVKVIQNGHSLYFPRLVSNNFVFLGKSDDTYAYYVNKTTEGSLTSFDVLVCG